MGTSRAVTQDSVGEAVIRAEEHPSILGGAADGLLPREQLQSSVLSPATTKICLEKRRNTFSTSHSTVPVPIRTLSAPVNGR
ncbi:hypothetical protein UFOVP276_94 [uncultured Caudovirales phage]|uniref:Uncharacterized protein n=1 Tax=uncultured Caudovirales phage TaxID=2100421 RepID=A0A6J5LCB8_9CAUD|nr:hypothetical protein UFOVP127_231 [uncultured Caudovirales phage]CAB4135138.1 hypothetical protein UFOVP276_94 [uncultured Caudovirales phage]